MRGWSALLAGLGAVAVVFGLLSVLLWIAGGRFDPNELPWIWANFAIGILLLGVALLTNFDTLRERMRSGEARRAGKYGTTAILSTVLSIAILGGLGFLAARHSVRWDWSEAKVHSLSDQTLKLLAGLERDVEVTAFFAPLEAAPVRDLLSRYSYASPRFKVEFADPTARPDLIERFGITPEKLGRGLLRIGYGEESVEVTEVREPAITNAIVKLTRTSSKKVYFVEGHSERVVEGEGADGKEGFGQAAQALRNENYRVETLLIAARGEVPDDADVVVLAGPTRNFLPEEHAALRRYLDRGGALFVMLDPRARSDLAQEVAGLGVELGEDVIVDRVQGLFGRAATPFAGEYADHPITRDMREVTLFHVARSVRAADSAKARFTEIVKTGPESWGERDLDLFFGEGRAELSDTDLKGPVPLAVAGTLPKPAGAEGEKPAEAEPEAGESAPEPGGAESRIVVIGDSDFASNQLLDAYRNRDLFVNSVNWLLGDVEAIAIRPNQSRASRLQLSGEQLSRIRYLSLFVLPEAIAFLGVCAWWSRRRAPGR